MYRLLLPFFLIGAIAGTAGMSGTMSTICSVVILCGYLDWREQGMPRFTLRGQAR